jgi:DNA polymerase/3'-5' exonuclease PolX
MAGWRSDKIRRPRANVEPWVNEITDRLGGGLEVHVCGSWRRGRELIGDLDVLIIDDGIVHPDIGVMLAGMFTPERGEFGGALVHGHIPLPDGELHVDLYGATPEQRGGFLWHLTGPKELNIAMRSRALRRDRMLNQYGLWQGDTQLDDGTEYGIARQLNCKHLLEPTTRENWQQPVGAAMTARTVPASDGVRTYTVTERDGVPESCTCPGFKYRRNCRHINQPEASA